jgi:DNA-binding NtrC family response regulator
MYRILIVDDEETVRYTLKQFFSKYGFAPYEASGGAEAITAVKSLDLDLILLDLVMPKPDGMETLLELKKIDPDMPVIMMTGQGDISTAVQAIKTGAYDFITKPFQTNKLIQVIQGGLERFELRRSVKQLQTSLEWIFGESTAMGGGHSTDTPNRLGQRGDSYPWRDGYRQIGDRPGHSQPEQEGAPAVSSDQNSRHFRASR